MQRLYRVALALCFYLTSLCLSDNIPKENHPNLTGKWISAEPYILTVINIKTREVAEYTETHEIDLVQHGTHITGNGSWFTDDGTSGTETLIGSFITENELAFVELDVDDEQVPPEQEAPALGYAQNQVHAVYVDPYLKWVAVGGNGLKGITFTVWFEREEEKSKESEVSE